MISITYSQSKAALVIYSHGDSIYVEHEDIPYLIQELTGVMETARRMKLIAQEKLPMITRVDPGAVDKPF